MEACHAIIKNKNALHWSVVCMDVRIKEDLICLHMEEAALAAAVTAEVSVEAAVADRAEALAADALADLEGDVLRWAADRRWVDRLRFITTIIITAFFGDPDGDGDRAITVGADVFLLLW